MTLQRALQRSVGDLLVNVSVGDSETILIFRKSIQRGGCVT
jgi:hypothetical protein